MHSIPARGFSHWHAFICNACSRTLDNKSGVAEIVGREESNLAQAAAVTSVEQDSPLVDDPVEQDSIVLSHVVCPIDFWCDSRSYRIEWRTAEATVLRICSERPP